MWCAYCNGEKHDPACPYADAGPDEKRLATYNQGRADQLAGKPRKGNDPAYCLGYDVSQKRPYNVVPSY